MNCTAGACHFPVIVVTREDVFCFVYLQVNALKSALKEEGIHPCVHYEHADGAFTVGL